MHRRDQGAAAGGHGTWRAFFFFPSQRPRSENILQPPILIVVPI
jgi:hypothetical protein